MIDLAMRGSRHNMFVIHPWTFNYAMTVKYGIFFLVVDNLCNGV